MEDKNQEQVQKNMFIHHHNRQLTSSIAFVVVLLHSQFKSVEFYSKKAQKRVDITAAVDNST
jgi:hypothetical protein